MHVHFVYMLTNASRVVLYIGVTNDVARRVWQHQNGASHGFSKKYKLSRLVYVGTFHDVREAIAREKQLKRWTRVKKNALVESENPNWIDLSAQFFDQVRGPSTPLRSAQDDNAVVATVTTS